MKIAILTPTFSAFSGIDRVVELQAQEFIDKGHEVTIFTLKGDLKPKKAKLVVMGMPKNQLIERVYRLFFFIDSSKIRKYGKMLKEYDKVISHFYPMNILGMYAKKHYGTIYIYHNHGIADSKFFNGFIEKTYMKILKFLTNFTIKDVDYANSISIYLRDVLEKETGIDSGIVYDPIDKKRFHKGISGKRIRKKYNLGKDLVCLYIGRISPHKGIDLLIQSFNEVLKEKPNAKLLIVGKQTFSNYAKVLKQLANKVNSNAIIFTGFVYDKELPEYYSACDVYTTATLWEGFNMTVVEAQDCGKPVVAFNIGPHPEVVKKGTLVKEKDTEAFSKAILKEARK